MLAAQCLGDGGATIIGARGRFGASGEQQIDQIAAATHRRLVQRRDPAGLTDQRIGAAVEQQLGRGGLAREQCGL